MAMEKETTHFGYQQVPTEEKSTLVKGVFDSVASRYDVMNDLMSLGAHRLWKKFAIQCSGVRSGQKVLDVAGGTGDLTKAFAKKVGHTGFVFLTDINQSMLQIGRDRLINQGICQNVYTVQADAECLPFPDNYFDCISIAFGLRNVTNKAAALRSMYRIVKPGGRLLILEFSKPTSSLLSKVYDAYSFSLLPKMGKWVADDEKSYQYLAESIRMHPDQETLNTMLLEAGFSNAKFHNLSGGIVALHMGYKY